MLQYQEDQIMEKLTIALLCGGISSEREVSLHSGDQVYAALDKSKYQVLRYDPKTDLAQLVSEASQIDAALIILHGPYGEDGTVQGLLDLLDIPYQGAGVLGSAVAMNKLATKKLYERAGLPIPAYAVVEREDAFQTAAWIDRLGLPMVVKPVCGGSSVGMSIVKSADQLGAALDKAFVQDEQILLEAYVGGTELTGGVIGNKHLEALPLIEIVPNSEHEFFDYEAKYTAGVTQEICPARIDARITARAQSYAVRAHQALFCRGYSRTDMILKDDEIYLLETNTIPGMTATSLLPQAAEKAGLDFSRLLDRLIELSLEGRDRGTRRKTV
jgi:D-alanine-D-alanine ligase